MKRKKVGMFLIIVGLAIIGSAFFMKYQGELKQKQMLQSFEKTLEEVDKGQNDIKKHEGSLQNDKEIEGAIGVMKIPKIDLVVALGDGVDKEILRYSVGHFKGTAMPGEKGNFCVAGHRSYTYNQFFNRLDELKNGDDIIVKTKRGEFKYRIYDKKVVEPTEVSVLDATKDSEITLVTCTPIRIATHRLIIKGKLIAS